MSSNSTICPLCNKQNACTANHHCWCMKKSVPKDLINEARKMGIDQRCICQACIEAFERKQNQDSE